MHHINDLSPLQDQRFSQWCWWPFKLFWDVGMWCCQWLCSSRNFEGWQHHHLQGEALQSQLFFLECLALKLKALWSFQMSGPTHHDTVLHPTRTESQSFSCLYKVLISSFSNPPGGLTDGWIMLHAKNSLHVILYSNCLWLHWCHRQLVYFVLFTLNSPFCFPYHSKTHKLPW